MRRTFLLLAALLPLPLLSAAAQRRYDPSKEYPRAITFLRDTLYVLDSTYIEINLREQMVIQHFRDGRVDRRFASTGDSLLPGGVITRTGIFSITGRERRHRSRQFGLLMHYWLPFDRGIGLHALDGNDYHRYLGRTPSTHGCVRLTSEDASGLFATVRRGTTVFVHNGRPARILLFGGSADTKVIDRSDADLLRQRLDAVGAGRWNDSSFTPRLALPVGRELAEMIPVGEIPVIRVDQEIRAMKSQRGF